jgi:hypothetical protein
MHRSLRATLFILLPICALLSYYLTAEKEQLPSLLSSSSSKEEPLHLKNSTKFNFLLTGELNCSECSGKERLLEIMVRAGRNVTKNDCLQLPLWSQVTSLYGEEPIIIGLETCERYRSAKNEPPLPRVAGLFNTGTNALERLFNLNFADIGDYRNYQVFSGKHVTPSKKWLSKLNETDVYGNFSRHFPVTLIKDPFRWMQSMCKLHYTAEWTTFDRCPNLIPGPRERRKANQTIVNETFHVKQRIYENYTQDYDSLADMWSKWNLFYYQEADFPRLIVRFEDTLFHLEAVMKQISDCIGMPLHEPFQYSLSRSKPSKRSNDFITAMAKYGRDDGRYDGFTKKERRYLQKALDPDLMKTFHYAQIPISD